MLFLAWSGNQKQVVIDDSGSGSLHLGTTSTGGGWAQDSEEPQYLPQTGGVVRPGGLGGGGGVYSAASCGSSNV